MKSLSQPKLLRRLAREPLLIACGLWPLVLLAPHLPGLPRPSLQGLPWKQELLFSSLLCATLFLSLKRARTDSAGDTPTHGIQLFTPLALAAFAAWVSLSTLWAANPFSAANLASQWVAYAVFLALSTAAASRPRVSRSAFAAICAVVWILGVSCAVETLLGGALTDGSLRADLKPILRGSGGFGEMMAVAAPLFAALALYLRRPSRALACGATAALAWLAAIQSLERAPFLGCAAGLLLLFTLSLLKRNCRPRSWTRAAALAAVLAAVPASQWLLSPTPDADATTTPTPTPTATITTTTTPAPTAPAPANTIARLQTNLKEDDSTRARLLFWGVGLEMLRARPLLGVGGNNYEVAFPDARARFSERHPDSPLVALNEQLLVIYAHNEYIQLAAELGSIGLLLFLIFAASLAHTFLRALRHPTKALPALGAGAGLLAFALSSGASASSFRYFGGGLLFFFAASIVSHVAASADAERALTKPSALTQTPTLTLTPRVRRALTLSALAASVVITCCAGLHAAGTILYGVAQTSADAARAERLYKASLAVDGWSAPAQFGYGMWLYSRGRAADSLPHLRFAAANGMNTSVCLARLAAAESEAGETQAAERTLARGVRAYPRSVFLRVRHALALEGLGLHEEAALEISAAELLDSRTARGWRLLIFDDIDAAIDAARSDPECFAMPGELLPEDAVFAVLQENERRFPEFANTGWRAFMRSFRVQ